MNQLLDELDAISGRTEFNRQTLLDDSFTNKKFQIGANSGQHISVSIGAVNIDVLGIDSLRADASGITGGILTQEGANGAIAKLDEAINKVSSERSRIEAKQNRLEHTINNLAVTQENLIATESYIRDADIAKETMNFTKHQILSQVAMFALAQANQIPQGVLQLLRQQWLI